MSDNCEITCIQKGFSQNKVFNATYLKLCQLSCARHYFVVGVNNFGSNSKNKKKKLFIAVLINSIKEHEFMLSNCIMNVIPINSALQSTNSSLHHLEDTCKIKQIFYMEHSTNRKSFSSNHSNYCRPLQHKSKTVSPL